VTCTEFLALLDESIDDAIAAPIRADIEQHMHKCGHCEVVFNTTLKTIEIYRSHEIYELPEDVRERLHAAILAKCKKGCK
jgi:hypothetical protein